MLINCKLALLYFAVPGGGSVVSWGADGDVAIASVVEDPSE